MAIKDPNWALSCNVEFLQFQKERVEIQEITGATIRDYALQQFQWILVTSLI